MNIQMFKDQKICIYIFCTKFMSGFHINTWHLYGEGLVYKKDFKEILKLAMHRVQLFLAACNRMPYQHVFL